MLQTLALLCSVSVDPSACTRRTAIDFYPLPTPTVICGIGDAMSAATQLRAKPGVSYIVTRCERGARGGEIEFRVRCGRAAASISIGRAPQNTAARNLAPT